MSRRIITNTFVGIMLIIDVVVLGLINSSVLPVGLSPIVIGFALFGLSPALAYFFTSDRIRTRFNNWRKPPQKY